ncbi:MAG: phytoene desaturase family protein [Chloroflexota bacterium]
MKSKTAVVIGAGMGGIAAAARLARSGYRVSVYEMNNKPGGRVDQIEKDGFRFDTGPTLFLMPPVFAETFAALGERMEDHLDLVRIDPTYRVHFHDGSRLDITSDLIQMREQLDALEPGAFERYLKFLAEGYRHYNLSLQKFVGRNFYNLSEFLSVENLPMMWQLKPLQKHASNTAKFFKDQRLRAAFSFQNMYLGLSPYDAPATYNLLQYTEIAEGVWFPKGGFYEVAKSLEAVARGLGVNFYYNSPVAQINVENNRTTGITLKTGERVDADVVIANADLPYVYSELLPDDGTTRKLAGKKYTSSTLMFYWGLKGNRATELLHHNVFLSDHAYESSFKTIFKALGLPEEPSFYINAPARTDPNFAPADGDSLMVLVPVGHLDERQPQDWPALEAHARSFVLRRLGELGLNDVASQITFEAKWGPAYYQKHYHLAKGAAFGLSHNFTQVGYLRPHNRHSRYRNLYFVGASTHPGTGVPIVLLSAKLVTERILNEMPPEAHSEFSWSPAMGGA